MRSGENVPQSGIPGLMLSTDATVKSLRQFKRHSAAWNIESKKNLACSYKNEYLHCAKLGISAITGLIRRWVKTQKTTFRASSDALLGTFSDRHRESLSATS